MGLNPGVSADGEWLQGWAHQVGQPITIWLHSQPALPPVPVLCVQNKSRAFSESAVGV